MFKVSFGGGLVQEGNKGEQVPQEGVLNCRRILGGGEEGFSGSDRPVYGAAAVLV